MIKRLFIAATICLASSIGSRAQETFRQELAVGASMGANFSSVTFNPSINEGMLMGINGGATIRWITEKNLGLQAELNFSQQGWKEQFDEPGYKYSRTINYIELPIMTHIYFGSKRFNAFLNLGPKIGYAISESTDQNIDGATTTQKHTEQYNLPVQQKFDWGLCGGPGVELRTGIGYFLLEGRYYYALGDIFNSRKEDYFSKSASQVFSVKLTYLIPVIK